MPLHSEIHQRIGERFDGEMKGYFRANGRRRAVIAGSSRRDRLTRSDLNAQKGGDKSTRSQKPAAGTAENRIFEEMGFQAKIERRSSRARKLDPSHVSDQRLPKVGI